MPIVDHWANNRKRVEPLLEPGEQMLAFSAAGLSHGVVPQPPPPPPPAHGKVAGRIEDVATGGVGDERKFDRLLFGEAVTGSADSLAADANRKVSAPGTSVFLGVTDRRLLILSDDSEPDSQRPLPLAWQIHRKDVTGADVHTRFLSFGRLRIMFRDGSSIVFVSLLLMGPTRAKRLRDALRGTVTTAL